MLIVSCYEICAVYFFSNFVGCFFDDDACLGMYEFDCRKESFGRWFRYLYL